MAVTNFTPLLGLALPTTGDLSGTWGTTVNDSITSLLDSAVAGTTTLSTDADVTLSTTNGATNQARNAVLLCTGSRSALRTITAPAQSKAYIVVNSTTGGYSVKVVGAGPTTGVTVAAGESALIAWNGSDFVVISRSALDLSNVTGTLSVSHGGSGQSSFTAYGVLVSGTTSTGAFQQVSGTGTSGQVLTSSGAGSLPSWQNTAAGGYNTQIQYNNGTTLGGVANLTWDGTTVSITNPTVTNYTETLYAANTGSAITINLANGTIQKLTLNGNPTITMPTAVTGKSFLIMLKQDATGGRTVTWSTVVWPLGVAPILSSGANKMDIFSFFSDGTNWYGVTVGQSY
jgi:hypothetical protein